MLRRLLGVCVALAVLFTAMPSQQAEAQTVVTIGTGTNWTYQMPYSTYYYTKWYTANLYNAQRIASANGGTAPIGLISRLELQGGYAYYNAFADFGQNVRIYLATSPNGQFSTNGSSFPSFNAFIGGSAPANLSNVQLVYTGKFLTSPLADGAWAGVDLDTRYLYNGGNLVLIIRNDMPGPNYTFPGGYGSFRATYLFGGPPAGTSYTSLYWYGYDFGDYTESSGYNYDYYGLPNLRISVLSGIEASFPDDVDPRRILRAGEVYGGQDADHPAPSLTFRASPGATELTYRIVSLATGQAIYTATDNGVASDTIINLNYTSSSLITYNFTSAKGIAAGTNGILDLTNIPGGAFRLEASYRTPATGYSQNWVKEFNIAYPNDLSVRQITAPNPSTDARAFKYPRGTPIPVQARFQNVGLNNVTSFRGVAQIFNSTGSRVYTDTVNYTGSFGTGAIVTIDFANFATLNVGNYTLRICGTLLNAADQQSGNDCMPVTGTYTFTVQYGVEAEATAIIRPNSTANTKYYAGRPIQPFAVFTNTGIEDLSDIPATMTIKRVGQTTPIYTSSIIISDIARNSSANATFADFTPPSVGQYEACVSINHDDDAILSNNTICATFDVLDALSGTYTIGMMLDGNTRNFRTMQDAVDALYSRGVNGPVVFEFTDANYTVGNTAINAMALDMRSTILGVNATNTITFKPSSQRSTSKGSVTINLRSGTGIGIALGEAYAIANTNAVFNDKKTQGYANATGYITFDGGAQKSLRFTLESNNEQRAVFHLGNEANNTTIRNVIIENSPSSTASYQSTLPRMTFNPGNLTFNYDGDRRSLTNGTVLTYSAGIVMRNTPTTFGNLQSVTAGVADTNTSDNNRVIGNEISGFGFGVVGIGIGPLYRPVNGSFVSYYAKGMEIRDNVIQNVSRAGIYVANTEGAEITGNRIASVGVTSTGVQGEASGILAGGESSYNNMNIRIARNEISGVTSNTFARGIAFEQVEQEFQNGSGTQFLFPNVGRNKTMNNMVWGISRTASTANAAGIHYLTQRSAAQTGINQLLTPQRVRFFTAQDTIAGNTVLMTNDNQTGAGVVAGIGVQQAKAAVVMNNAIAVLGGSTNASTGNTALLFQGMLNQKIRTGSLAGTMTNDAIISNRNAFWTPNGATIARFVQVDNQSRTVTAGSYDEYTTLGQWRQGTGNDMNSVYGDFTQDHEFVGIAPLQRLRVKTTPNTPIGSILNNRGERLSNLGTDIDNETRGAAGQRPDIGGDEFNGRLYVNDIEAVEIMRPGSYRATTGNFRDAEYIMTQLPINVTGRVRNGGSVAQADAPITVRIYAESAGSAQVSPIAVPGTYSTSPIVNVTLRSNLPAGESVDIDFTNLGFTPQTYAELGMAATAPAQFRTMAQNVTPRYRIEIETIADENNSNNITSKEVRFYLVKSPIRMLASVSGSTVNLSASPTANQIAARLNGDTLRTSLRALGWDNNGVNVSTYDLFDRDNWEPRAVDYTPYRTLLWAHDQNAMTMTARNDIRNYVYSGSIGNKKNLAISSQEIARKHIGFDPVNDEDFVRSVLRTQYITPGTPFQPDYNGRRVIGMAVAEATADFVRTTAFAGDVAPVPSLVRVFSDATTEGLARAAYKYETRTTGVIDSIMGVATTNTYANVVYLGVDWRHFARTANQGRSGAERVLRGVLDFFEKNGGTVVPVELAGQFQGEALRRDNNWTVNLWWKVASEVNVANYDVERAEVTARGTTDFTSVASTTPGRVNYQVEDRSVEANRTYVYRLRSTDRDGSSNTSNEVEISTTEAAESTISMQPMPVTGNSATLNFTAVTDASVEFVVFDAQGAEVARFTANGATGQATLDASRLSAGAYTIQMLINGQNGDNFSFTVIR